jgi:hypothetical protein
MPELDRRQPKQQPTSPDILIERRLPGSAVAVVKGDNWAFLSNIGSASATVNLYPHDAQGPDGLGAKTRQFDVRSSASVEVEAIRER